MKKFLIVLTIIVFASLFAGCSTDIDVGEELLTLGFQNGRITYSEKLTNLEKYIFSIKDVHTDKDFLPNYWQIFNTKSVDISEELDKKNNLFDALNHAGNIAENSKVPTFFSYIKNDLHLETKEESDNFAAISTFTYDLPNELKKLLGNSGKLCVFIDDGFVDKNTAHPDVEGIYMAYGIVLIKEPKTTPKSYNLNDFNQVAEKLVDKVINGMYEDTPSAKVDKTTIRRDEYKSAIQEYLYKEYCALVENDTHDGYLIEKGVLRFDFDMKNPEVYWKKPISEELEVEDFYDYLEKKNIEDAKYICTLSDIDNHWAKNTISTLASMKAIDGYSDGTYKPNKKVTDAEFLTIFTRAIEKDKIDDCFIQQSKYDNTVPWWQAFFVAAHDVGLIDAYKHRVFMDEEMTRERMIYYICSYLDISGGEYEIKDINDASSEYVDAIKTAFSVGLVSGQGNGYFAPKSTLTRAEAAQVVLNTINYLNNNK